MHAAYDGSHYKGWQTQPHANTIQDVIEDRLSRLTSQQIRIYGSGRTDTGVHAEDQPFHFDLDDEPDLIDLTHRLNRFLPPDIAITKTRKVQRNFHARFDANYRQYRYQITTRKDPLRRHFSYHLYQTIDFDLFRQGLNEFRGEHDFRFFCIADDERSSSICNVTLTELQQIDDHFWIVKIGGNRFMKHMVRFIIGTLIHFASGKMDRELLHQLLSGDSSQPNPAAGAPANGLVLEKVTYPEERLKL